MEDQEKPVRRLGLDPSVERGFAYYTYQEMHRGMPRSEFDANYQFWTDWMEELDLLDEWESLFDGRPEEG